MIGRLAALGCFAALAPAAGAQTPKMSEAQARDLYAAGGFPISADGRNPTNRCGAAASPKITFVDMNGDGRREALFIDAGTCYRPDGRWYAVTTQDTNGRWRRVLEGQGTVQAAGTQANGWFVLNTTSGGKTIRRHYNGTTYSDAQAPLVQSVSAAPPTGGRDAAIFRAAGFKQVRGRWESGCYDPESGAPYDPGKIDEVRDINGDGRPDAVVSEGTSYCYGMTGQGFWLISQQADGSWKLMFNQTGIPEFLTTKGAGGWPDISIGGPGFCFPVVRWNGREYAHNRFAYEGKPCSPPR